MDPRSGHAASSLAPSLGSSPPWRRALPLLTAAALVVFVIARLDVGLLLRQLGRVNYLALLSFASVVTLGLITADTFATVGIYRRTVCPVSFRQLFVLRAASYLPALLNHHVGQAWLTYFMSKTYRAPLWRVAGATLVTYASTLGCLVLFVIVALPFNIETIPWLPNAVVPVALLGLAYLAVIAAAPRFLREWQSTAPLVETGVRGHLLALAQRVPHMVVLFVATWVPFQFFGVRIPLAQALATIPPVMLVVGLPITPQGVGTRDVLAVQLFSGYVSGTTDERRAAIVAASLCWAGALTLVQLVISPFFMRRARQLLKDAA
jgi:hypothetical protein